MTSALSDFIFRGLMATHAIRDLRASGALRSPADNYTERKDIDLFAPAPESIRNSSAEMQRYYRLLYVFENSVREFVSSRIAEVDGEAWFDKRATAEMKQRVAKRKASQDKNQWHVGRNEHPLYLLDFGDLGLLIVNNWDLFKDFFPSQVWVQSRIQEGERTRNVIAHTNILSADEGVRLEMYLRDWLMQID